MDDPSVARHNMIESQIRTNKVTDGALIGAMGALPRELFVPEPLRPIAYVDEDLDIGDGRHLMEPMVLARLLQAAAVRARDVALVVGCGSGYSAAVLGRMCTTVVALESNPSLVARSTALLSELGIDNAVVIAGGLAEGHPDHAPYDVILIDGAVAEVPAAILDQLAEGGRLVTVVGGEDGVGRGTLYGRRGGITSRRVVFDASTPLLPGFAPPPRFEF